jgi:hypothetical protein
MGKRSGRKWKGKGNVEWALNWKEVAGNMVGRLMRLGL